MAICGLISSVSSGENFKKIAPYISLCIYIGVFVYSIYKIIKISNIAD